MQTYRVETEVSEGGTLTIKGLPFRAGDKVEVIVRSCEPEQWHGERYPLRGKPVLYIDPFGSVAEDDFIGLWENREDLKNSLSWVRDIRRREWQG